MTRLTFVFFLMLLFFSSHADAFDEDSGASLIKADIPIEVSSDRLEAEDLAGRVTFLGNVVVKRGELSLYAPEVEVYYLQGTRDVERIEAHGGVRIVQGERVLTSDSVLYSHREEKVLLKGNARVFREGNSVEGDEITVFLRDEKSVVTGGSGSRVNAVFQPKETMP